MYDQRKSRREFFGASAGVTAAMASVLTDPPHAAAQAAGVKRGDLPDLTIKEVKVYVADLSGFRRLNGTESGEIVSVVTNSGHEGNYTLGNRAATPNWLDWAKPALVGKNVIDLLPTITATSGTKATFGFGGRGVGAGRGGGGGSRGAGGRGGAAGAAGAAQVEAPALPEPAAWAMDSATAAAAHGLTTTPRRLRFACGTSWARPWTAPSTKSSAARRPA